MSRSSGVVILVSGRGSNMQAILQAVAEGQIPVTVRAVVSNRADAEAIAFAKAAGVTTEVIPHTNFTTRDDFDRALAQAIDRYDPQLVVLAGFMRILTPDFIRRYEGRLINIHPSLLPAFPGLDTHRRAIESRAPRHGATVHFVTPEVDSGPIIAQAIVPILPNDSPTTLAARVLEAEHRIYPLAIRWFVEGRLTVQDGSVLLDGARRAEQGIASL